MKVKWKRLWIKALRSGKFKQTERMLHDRKGYCCLGVLCKVMEPNTKWKSNKEGAYLFEEEQMFPPARIMKEATLRKPSARVLAKMNDKGKTFKQIAAFISKHY